jgi:hypothetical protein
MLVGLFPRALGFFAFKAGGAFPRDFDCVKDGSGLVRWCFSSVPTV